MQGKEKKGLFRCTATGDSMITRRLPEGKPYEGFEEIRQFIGQGDFRFSNLETTVHNFESFGNSVSGGSWLCSPPGVLSDMRKFGFNVLSTANNHALDYGHGGLLRTLDYLRKAEYLFSGTGENLAVASAPVYLDTAEGRYALISCMISANTVITAGEQSRTLQGRPGVNNVGYSQKFRLPKEELSHIKRIADTLSLNAASDIIRAEGYLPQLKEGEQPFGAMMFEAGDRAETVYTLRTADMIRIESAIQEARFMADYVVVSFHNHLVDGMDKAKVDPLSVEFAHRCIDAGADALIGTGPHLLRPMEIYKGKPVFYCLGDFIIQLETLQRAPADMFAKEKLDGNCWLDQLFNARSDNGKRGLCYSRVMFETVIPYWEVQDGVLKKMTLLPVEENFELPLSRNGWPRKLTNAGILERFGEMSKAFGVEMEIVDGIGVVKL